MRRTRSVFILTVVVALLVTCVFAAGAVPNEVLEASESVVRIRAEYSDGYSTGSGFVIRSDREATLIVTNYHVVEGSPYNISVWVAEDETVSASILAYTSQKDMCVLKLAYPISMKTLPLAASSAAQGEAVYAVGFPAAADYLSDKDAHMSADATITHGIVSAVREATISSYGGPAKILQINAAINSGNSGGPLFNTKGQVIGINTYGIGDAQGIFGAIDVSELKGFLTDNAITYGSVGSAKTALPNLLIVAVAVVALAVIAFVVVLVMQRRKNKPVEKAPSPAIISFKDYITPEQEEAHFVPNVVEVHADDEPIHKRKCSKLGVAALCLAIVVVVFVGTYVYGYFRAVSFAKHGDIERAENHLFISQLTRLHDGKLTDYIQAHHLLTDRQYLNAKVAFEALGDYNDAAQLVFEADYRLAAQYADANDFNPAINIYSTLGKAKYKDSAQKVFDTQFRQGAYLLYEQGEYEDAYDIFSRLDRMGVHENAEEMLNETTYWWGLDLVEQEEYITAYEKLTTIEGYLDTADIVADLKEYIYSIAQSNYRLEKFDAAAELFVAIHPYKQSLDYLTLIKRCSFFAAWSATSLSTNASGIKSSSIDSGVDSLIDIFYFENTAEVLLMDTSTAGEFLLGTWRTSDWSFYFTMGEDHRISYNLPRINYGDYYKIENGYVLLFPKDDESNTKNLFAFEAITPDTLEVYCYKNGYTYTLYRQ